MEEARLEPSEYGLWPATEGWFVVNVRDAAWTTSEAFGEVCFFESDAAPFADVGYSLLVFRPGQPSGLYHREANQEDFLVLAGECLLLVEGEERPLRAWDFVHCPAGTDHIFVATGDGPCVIFMAGARAGWPEKGRLSALRDGFAPRRRRREGDELARGGLRAVPEVEARARPGGLAPAPGGLDETWTVPPGRAARPEGCVLSRARR